MSMTNVVNTKNRVRELLLNESEETAKLKSSLAKHLGVSWRTVHRWYMNPEMDIPLSTSLKIAEFFNVTVEDVAANTGEDEKAQ